METDLHKLKQIRKNHNYTQLDVANAIHIEEAAYGRLERGETELSRNIFLRLAEFYGYKPWEFELMNSISNETGKQIYNDNSTGHQYIGISYEIMKDLIETNVQLRLRIENLEKKMKI